MTRTDHKEKCHEKKFDPLEAREIDSSWDRSEFIDYIKAKLDRADLRREIVLDALSYYTESPGEDSNIILPEWKLRGVAVILGDIQDELADIGPILALMENYSEKAANQGGS